jgi:2-(1,2-epoxy-1,2-dihydrophenyl)acetyl-CoA isomerase
MGNSLTMTYKKLTTMELDLNRQIAKITLTRENALNAMNQQFFDDISSCLSNLQFEKGIKALIITGRGNGFSVGADLKNLPVNTDLDLGKALRENFEPLILGLKKLPFPTIAAVNGYAAGAGMGLMLGCDFTIAAKSAQFVQAFINIALVPDAGNTYFLPRLIGNARATEMMMLGEPVSAERAFEMGMIYKVVDDAELEAEADILANKLAQKPTSVLMQIRELLDVSGENSLADQLNAEADAQKIASTHDNFLEGVRAFNEKRSPKFE